MSDTSHVQVVCRSPEQSSPFAFPEELDVHTLSVGAYVLSLNSRGKSKTLHRVGSCWRTPGIHYSKFEFVDDDEL